MLEDLSPSFGPHNEGCLPQAEQQPEGHCQGPDKCLFPCRVPSCEKGRWLEVGCSHCDMQGSARNMGYPRYCLAAAHLLISLAWSGDTECALACLSFVRAASQCCAKVVGSGI